jgi:hypothetical protein
MSTEKLTPPFLDRKISETFLSFAEPMFRDMPTDMDGLVPRVDSALKVAYAVWNAVVIADVLGDDSYLADLRRRMGSIPGSPTFVETLIFRKRALFGDDARIIGTYEVYKTADGFNVRADARDPHTLPPRGQQ